MKGFKPNYDDGMWKGAPDSSFLKARELRKNETAAEKVLWERLKNNQVKSYKFRRQHPIGLYIADFYCHKLKLIIEVDGDYHLSDDQILKDSERTSSLNESGLQVIRFKNEDIIEDIESVFTKLRNEIKEIEKNKE